LRLAPSRPAKAPPTGPGPRRPLLQRQVRRAPLRRSRGARGQAGQPGSRGPWPNITLGRYRATVAGDGQRALLFLDVDGPLLPFGGSAQPGPGEPAGVPHLARLRLDAGPRLAGLPCTLVWATTWLEDANTEIAPRLGLPGLPVVTWPEPDRATEREDQWLGLCWKTRTVVAWAAG